MFRSLYSKLAAVLTGLFCLVGLAIIIVTLFSTEMYQQEVNQRLNRRLAAQIVAEKILMQENRVNQEALADIFHMLMVINPSIEVYLLDARGNILEFSASPGKVKRSRVDLEPIRDMLEKDVTIPLRGDDPRDPGGKKVFTVARIPEQGQLQGYLYVILGGETYDSVVQKLKASYILQLSAWMIFASLFFALIAGLVLFASLTGRLKRLANAMDAFRSGTGHQPMKLPRPKRRHGTDDIDRLELAFTEMSARIEDQLDQLHRSDTMRRELIANVSHDLRTPLATLQGYIETMLLKEDDLDPPTRRSYLETAIKHCERLSKLVSELLELAKLDSYDIRAEREPFNLSELVQDVVQKFQIMASDKQITLSTTCENNLPFVNADIGLIERVLENLIENAVRNTPPGGSVRLLLKPQQENVAVQVSDTGHGIPTQDLSQIFNRFYQLEKSRKSEQGHSGLGLAITKKILELHDRSIDVASALGTGTTFSFQLPVKSPA
ncbi:Two-component system sensor histidine kinase [Olavius sp. associated proteobacterium Delta 1]|nr:Two-component system sensor histidine kinase [Olavius sp. associated proteobacterium Delta 1]